MSAREVLALVIVSAIVGSIGAYINGLGLGLALFFCTLVILRGTEP